MQMNNKAAALAAMLIAAAFTSATLPASADTLRDGFSVERLARVDALLDQYVNDGQVAGVVALVLRDGKPVYQRAVGWADKEAGRKMAMDTEFRIASQSKALTSVAMLQLMEEGKLTLNDKAGKWIPTFSQTTVGTKNENGTGLTIAAAKRPITLKDLLTHTAGISYGTEPEVAALYEAKGSARRPVTASISRTRTSPSARAWNASAPCPSSRSPARSSCTATTPTFSAASSRRPRECRSTNSSARTSPAPWA